MAISKVSATYSGFGPTGFLSRCALLLLFLATFQFLSACAMSALIARGRNTLDAYSAQGPNLRYYDYDDPWDYLGFVMANSSAFANSDGYGVVAYSADDPFLDPQHAWYKRVTSFDDFGQTYYTGPYLDEGDQSDACVDDPLDKALHELSHGDLHPAIVLAHARSASGLTLGNHPFVFHDRDRSYSLMHNGNCNSARGLMIEEINALRPGKDWFALHPSNMGETDPQFWVDSELLFHFLVCHIQAAGDDVLNGLRDALGTLAPYIDHPQNGVINFIFSDGERLYAFRSSAANSSYKLSYREVGGEFYGIRTQAPGAGDTVLRPRELVVLSRDAKPLRLPDFSRSAVALANSQLGQPGSRQLPLEISPALSVSPNPFVASTRIRIPVPLPGPLSVEVFNLRGELVWRDSREVSAPGIATLVWEGVDGRGRNVPPGVYLLRVEQPRGISLLRLSRLR